MIYDIGSLLDPNKAISMTEFDGIAFLWNLMATSPYHSDIITLSKGIENMVGLAE